MSNASAAVFDAFAASAAAHAARPFLRSPATPDADAQTWTYGAAHEEATRLASRYEAAGIGAGHRVALAMDSSLDVYLHLLALNALGASIVPLNFAGTDAELGFVIDHSDARLVVSLDTHVRRLGDITSGIAGCRSVTADDLPSAATAASPAPANAAREAALLYTSGTTGKPKGCMISNEYFLTLGRWYNGLGGYVSLDSSDRLLTPLPPNHMNALCCSFMAMLMAGGCVVQLDRFHPSSWWATVRAEKTTIIHYLGVMPAILLSLPEQGDDNAGGLVKFGFGAGVDPRHQKRFEERFGFPLLEAWAMTETGAGAATIASEEPRHVGERCIGRVPPEMEYRLVDESGADVPAGDPGELLVRRKGSRPRAGFFSGYYKDDAATGEAWRGGWFHTGDVVRAGPDGSLHFVDRRKNIIRRSGENIAAVEVEAALLAHPGVANCAATAVPDEMRGDEVFALVVPAAGSDDDEAAARAILDHCRDRLSYFKVPGYLAFAGELPLTASQKVSRKDVRSAALERLDQGDCFDVRHLKKRRPAAGS